MLDPKAIQLLVGVVVVVLGVLFIPTQLNDHPKTHCTNLPDGTGGYYPVCTDPTYVSIYTKHISKNY